MHAALRLAGAKPVHLRPGDPVDASGLDAVVVTGGHDVEPTLYQSVAEVEGRYDPERDAFESSVLGAALERKRPILAICRGAQLLNVHLGGSLFQDLVLRRRNTSGRRTLLPLKTVRVTEGSRLARSLGRGTVKVNSLHRQAVDRLGTGLRVGAVDLDGIVQAVELPERDFVVGVQWHPEFLLYLHHQRQLFRDLVRCATRAGTAPRADRGDHVPGPDEEERSPTNMSDERIQNEATAVPRTSQPHGPRIG